MKKKQLFIIFQTMILIFWIAGGITLISFLLMTMILQVAAFIDHRDTLLSKNQTVSFITLLPHAIVLLITVTTGVFFSWMEISKGLWVSNEYVNIEIIEREGTKVQYTKVLPGDFYLDFLNQHIVVAERDANGALTNLYSRNYAQSKEITVSMPFVKDDLGKTSFWSANGGMISYSHNFFSGFESYRLIKYWLANSKYLGLANNNNFHSQTKNTMILDISENATWSSVQGKGISLVKDSTSVTPDTTVLKNSELTPITSNGIEPNSNPYALANVKENEIFSWVLWGLAILFVVGRIALIYRKQVN